MTRLARTRVDWMADAFRRSLSVVVVAIYALTLGAPSLHLVLERHAVCLEHGEVAHVDVAPQAGDVMLVADGATVSATEDGEGHGHCGVPQCASASPMLRGAWVHADVAATVPVVDARAHDVARALSPLRFAPKTSPPVA